ncbi:MAG TPA: hypothetical protein VHV75_10160, partial [Solirubrobacteraceae bacterium]|nr:hypothetical protein [Solirubrobacteraceae bacterium]
MNDEEELIIRMMAEGAEETAASVGAVADATEDLGAKMDVTSAKAKGLFSSFTSLKTLVAGWALDKAVKSFASFQSQME